MSRVNTNNVSLRFSIEPSLAVAGTSWRLLEPNDITQANATIEKVARQPISNRRGRRKGIATTKESLPEWEADLTGDSLTDFIEGFMVSEFANVEFDLTHPKLVGAALDVTATGYALGAALSTFTNGTLLAGKVVFAGGGAISLFYAKGYALAANNGLKAITADLTGASTEVVTSGLETETAPANASLQVAGLRIPTGDVTFTLTAPTATLASTAAVADWSTYGLKPGQFIHIGSAGAAGVVQNALDDAGTDDNFGYARITSIDGDTLNLDKLDVNLTATDTNTGDLDIMFGRFVRDVPVDAADDDERFLQQTYHIEVAYPDLGGVGTPEYKYLGGNHANELAISLPLEDKATATWGFVGTSAETITPTRKTGAVDAVEPLRNDAVGTMTNIPVISTDVVSSLSDICFQDLTLTITNNMTTQSCLGHFGPKFVNMGLFEVNLEGQMLFVDKAIEAAVEDNTTVTGLFIIANDDFGAAFDMPSMTLGDGSVELPVNESVLINITGETFTDATLGYNMGISLFANVPTVRPD